MRIGLVMQGGAAWAGGAEYIGNLAFALASLPREERAKFELFVIDAKLLDAATGEQLRPHVDGILKFNAPAKGTSFASRVRERFLNPVREFASFLAEHRIDFLYPLTYDNTYNLGIPMPSSGDLPCAWAGWIPDFQHRHLPQFFTGREIAARDSGIAKLLASAPSIVLSSRSACDDLRRFFPETKSRVEVLPFSTRPRRDWFEGEPSEVQKKFHLPDRFFIVSNQFWQHKNHRVVFEALAALRGKNVEPVVVCTGQLQDFRNKNFGNEVLQQLHTLGIATQVRLLGLIPRDEQIQLMRRALAMIQPSLFEGWSTVVEDARCLGKRLLLSDIPVHREQSPPGAEFFDPHSPEQLAEKIAHIFSEGNPGPDIVAESAAQTTAETATRKFAQRFLEITT